MARPTSFSQNMMFERCKRWWYYGYVKKVPAIQDTSYMDAGNVLHKSLEMHYGSGIDFQELKPHFEDMWKKKNLDKGMLRYKQDQYWLMVVHGVGLKKILTSVELKVFYTDDVIGFIDGVNTKDDELLDWKSSTRMKDNEEEYEKQLIYYSWLYKRKFNRLPKKATVYYLKYTGTKQSLEVKPTEEQVQEIEKWHNENKQGMEEIRAGKIPPKCETECHHFCPYKALCLEGDNVFKVSLEVLGNVIRINANISPLLNNHLSKKFSYELKNAHFIKRARPMMNTTVKFWNERFRTLPIGFYDALVKTLNDYAEYKKFKLALDVVDRRQFNPEMKDLPDKLIGKELRDYQEQAAIDFIRKKIGILEIATSGGKTLIAAEIIRQLGYKTLFIVDKVELLRQTKKVLEDTLGVPIGIIGQGHVETEHITVATIQTLMKNLKYHSKYLNSIRVVMFDEVQHTPSRSYMKVSKFLVNTEFRLGISATARRDDGNDMCITAVTGPKIMELNSKTLIDKGWLSKPKVIFVRDYMDWEKVKGITASCKENLISEKPSYANFYQGFISENNARNKAIEKVVNDNSGKKILVLTKLVEHGKMLANTLGGLHLYGETDKVERANIMELFKEGKNNVLVSTSSIMGEGVDIPELDIIINATANRGDIKSIQMLGRVMRLFEGKDARYYDFADKYHRFFKLATIARKKIFKEQEHDVSEVIL